MKITASECTTPRGNPNVKYGLWVIVMYQSKFVSKQFYIKASITNVPLGCKMLIVEFLLELENPILKNIRKTKKNSKSSRKDGGIFL